MAIRAEHILKSGKMNCVDSLSYTEASEFIRKKEEALDLLRFKVGEWSIWPVLRPHFGLALQKLPTAAKKPFPRLMRLKALLRDIPTILFMPSAHWLVKSYSSARSDQRDGLYTDIYFDDLLTGNSKFFKVELLNSAQFLNRSRQARIPSHATTTIFDLASAFLVRKNRNPDLMVTARLLFNELASDMLLAKCFSYEQILKIMRHFEAQRRVWKWTLRRVNPKQVLTADNFETGINAAARELGIEVVEFQHGAIDRQHMLYSWSKYAVAFKTSMPLPNKIFAYGDFWNEELLATGFWSEEVRPVGSLRMDHYRTLRKQRIPNGSTRKVLLTAQGIDTQRIIEMMSALLEQYNGDCPLKLIVKLHPVYDTATKPVYQNALAKFKNVEIISGAEEPSTFDLLMESDYHLSISSSCHYEAIGLGVPTIVLPFSSHEAVIPLCHANHARVVYSVGELRGILEKKASTSELEKISNYFFSPNAAINMQRELFSVKSNS